MSVFDDLGMRLQNPLFLDIGLLQYEFLPNISSNAMRRVCALNSGYFLRRWHHIAIQVVGWTQLKDLLSRSLFFAFYSMTYRISPELRRPWKKKKEKRKSLFEPPHSVHTLNLAACMRSGSVSLYCRTVRWLKNKKNKNKQKHLRCSSVEVSILVAFQQVSTSCGYRL